MKLRKVVAVILSAAFIFTMVGAVTASEAKADDTYTLVVSSHAPTGSMVDLLIQPFFEQLTERSGGRLQFEIFPNGSLVGMNGALDALSAGTCDISLLMSTALGTDVWSLGAYFLNGIFSDPNLANYAMADLYQNEESAFHKNMDDLGVTVIGAVALNPGLIYTKDLMTSMDYLNGKMVACSASSYAKILQDYGATCVSIIVTDLYEAVSKGTVDVVADNTALNGAISFGITEVCKYALDGDFGSAIIPIVINTSALENLPEDLQELLKGAWLDFEAELNNEICIVGDDAYERFEASGGVLTILSDEEKAAFREKAEATYSAWAEEMDAQGFAGTQMLNEFRDALVARGAAQ